MQGVMMGFGEQLYQFARKTNLRAETVFRKCGLSIAASLIQKSPVDTGRFRANWMLGIGSENTAVMEITDPDGNQTLQTITAQINEVKIGNVIYITNSLPYAIPLEFGWSKQAPNGMVRLTVAEWQSHVGKAVQGLGV
jgi:hypothetical protein